VHTATLTLSAGIAAWQGFASAFGLPLPSPLAWLQRIPSGQPLKQASRRRSITS